MTAPLNLEQLFTPSSSGVGTTPSNTPDDGTWLAFLINIAQEVGLPTTAWQSGGPEVEILALAAVALAQTDAVISKQLQGGFLDFAANGTVQTVAVNGQVVTVFVTPDPTIPSQWPASWNGVWQPGWLDELANSVYDVQRVAAGYATNRLAIANTTGSPLGPYVTGTYHASNLATGASYSNTASLSIPSSALPSTAGVVTGVSGSSVVTVTTQTAHGLTSGDVVYIPGLVGVTLSELFAAITVTSPTTFQLNNLTATGSWSSGGTVYNCTVAEFVADVSGAGSSSAPYTITNTVTSNAGVFISNVVTFTGTSFESNAALANRCRLRLQALSPNGPLGAFEYFALTSSTLLAEQGIQLNGGPITRAIAQTDPLTGIITTIIGNDNPVSATLGANVVEGVSNLAITAATNASPIAITTTSAHGLSSGDTATIAGVLGNLNANGTWTINVTSPTAFALVGSTGSGTYTGGGTVEGGDVGQVDRIIQANAVGNNETAYTVSATAFPVDIVATVVVPSTYTSVYVAAADAALIAYIGAIPIGGTIVPPSSSGVVDYSAIEGVLFAAGAILGQKSYVIAVSSLTVNGQTVDVSFPLLTSMAVAGTLTINVVAG